MRIRRPGRPDPEDAALQIVLERMRAAEKPVGGRCSDRSRRSQRGGRRSVRDAILDLDAGTLEILEPRGRLSAQWTNGLFVGAELDAAVALFVALEVLLQRDAAGAWCGAVTRSPACGPSRDRCSAG